MNTSPYNSIQIDNSSKNQWLIIPHLDNLSKLSEYLEIEIPKQIEYLFTIFEDHLLIELNNFTLHFLPNLNTHLAKKTLHLRKSIDVQNHLNFIKTLKIHNPAKIAFINNTFSILTPHFDEESNHCLERLIVKLNNA
jgi:hypothetical protein